MPGLRGTPDVMTTTSELAVSFQPASSAPAPMIRESDPSIGHASMHVERDALRLLVGDVDDDDVGQLLVGDRARHRRADVAGAPDDRDFSIHASSTITESLDQQSPITYSR